MQYAGLQCVCLRTVLTRLVQCSSSAVMGTFVSLIVQGGGCGAVQWPSGMLSLTVVTSQSA